MTNVSKNLLFAFSVFVSATVLSLGAFATTVQASEDWGYSDFGGGGWSDYSSYDGGYSDYSSYDSGYSDYSSYDSWGDTGYDSWSDYSSYDSGYNDTNSYDSGWSDYSSYDSGWYDTNSYDSGWNDTSSYDSGWTDMDSYNPGFYETDSYNPGFYETDSYNPGFYETDSYNPGFYETDSYNPGFYETESYNPGSYQNESYNPGFTTGGGYTTGGGSQQGGGYTTGGGYQMQMPRPTPPTPTPGCTSNCYPRPTPPTPGCTSNCYPQPHPTCPTNTTGTYPNCRTIPTPVPTCPQNTTGTYPNCRTIPTCTTNCYPQPTCTTCGGHTTNTNTNVNTIIDNSIIDNSINGSFNTNISNSGNVTTLYQAVPQQPVIYQQPIAPYCVITLANAGAYAAQATLVWSSSNAQSAYITSVGAVAVNGTRPITGYSNQVYSLTVTGQGGTYTCSTQAYTPGYVPPTITNPTVSLTQIPYTGLDLGPVGEAMYWLSIAAVAAAGAYLVVYHKGGALAFATTALTASRSRNHFVVSEEEAEEISTPVVEIEEEVATPVVSTFNFLPAFNASKTTDTMAMELSSDGTPRLVISRA